MSDTRPAWHTAVPIAVVAGVVDYLRLPASARDTLYAEDGPTFLGDWISIHSIGVLYRPYGGYQHLLPRLAGRMVTGLLPVQWWANAMTVIACVLVGSAAGLVYVFSRDVVASPTARLGLASITVLIPLAGVEAVGNMANLHWYLQYLMFWLLLAIPRSRAAAVLMTLLALVLALTEPQCALQVPLAIFVFVRRPAARPVVLGALIGIGLQVITYLLAPRLGNSGFPPLASAIKGYLVNTVLSDGWAGGGASVWIVRHVGWWFAVACLVVLLTLASYAFWRGAVIVRVAVVGALFASAAGWFVSFYVNNDPLTYYTAGQFPKVLLVRWGTAAAMLLLACVPLAVGVFVTRFPDRRRLPVSTILLMIAVMCVSLVSRDNRRGTNTPPWIPAVAVATASCRAAPSPHAIRVPISPPGWFVAVPCSDLR